MRTILFRGKRIDNGEWIYGYVFKSWEQVFIQWGTANGIPNMVEVNPETVSEFTGRYDKNGKDFYEGDIIRDTRDDSIGNDVIEWDGYRFIMKNYDDNDDVFHCPEYYEIIGNIYEYPNLIKE